MECTHENIQKTEEVQVVRFNKEQIEQLEQNPNVLQVLSDRIIYMPKFREKAMQEYEQGKTAKQIFIDAGFNISELSSNNKNYVTKTLSEWISRARAKGNNRHIITHHNSS